MRAEVTGPADVRPPPLYTPLFFLVLSAGFLQEIAWSLLVHFPGWLAGFGQTEARIGLLYSATALLALAARPWIGRIIDIRGRRAVILSAGLVNSIAIAALAAIDAFGPALVILFAVHRLMQIILFAAMLTMYADVATVERRTEGLAMLGLSGLVPLATGGALGDWLRTLAGFDGIFLVAAGAGFTSWALVWFVPRAENHVVAERRSFFAALRQRSLLPVWVLSASFAFGLETLFTFMRTLIDETETGSLGGYFLAYGGAAIAARLASSRRLDALPTGRLLGITGALYAGGIALTGAAPTPAYLYLAGAMAGIGHGVMFPVISNEVIARSRLSERGSAMTIFTAVFDVTLLAGAPAIGLVIERLGYPVAFATSAAVIGVGLIVFFILDTSLGVGPWSPVRRRMPSPHP